MKGELVVVGGLRAGLGGFGAYRLGILIRAPTALESISSSRERAKEPNCSLSNALQTLVL